MVKAFRVVIKLDIRDGGDAISEDYKTPGALRNGAILGVVVTVETGQYLDLERLAAAAMAVD